MTTDASGQLLGYTVQYFRALHRLLQCKSGESVSVEQIADVAVDENGDTCLLEEDKSSLHGNPLGDLSINLWKTFYNWIQFLLDSNTDVSKCRFVLYVVAPRPPNSQLLNSFAASKTDKKVKKAIELAKQIAAQSSSEIIKQYATFVLNEQIKVFRQILLRLDVEYRENEKEIEEDIFGELRDHMMVQESRVKEVATQFLGWLVKKIVVEIRENRTAIVSKNDFINENRAFLRSIRDGALQDYSLGCPPTNDVLESEVASDKIYVKQLRAIEVDSKKMQQACSDYLRAAINRHSWIENELISQADADEFERKLCSAFEYEKEQLELQNDGIDDVRKGKLLLHACEGQQIKIAERDPVDRTIPGTYHHLSDDCRVGWHPKWESMFKTGDWQQ